MNKKRIIPLIVLLLAAVLIIAYFQIDAMLYDGVRPQEVRENGLHGNLYVQEGTSPETAIILVGGGQWGDYWGQEFAKKGYIAFSLPYYRREGLPDLMEEIPLEYIEKAIDWLEEDSGTLPLKVVLMGASRNAELALLAAASFPEKVHGVIAYAPGSVHWSNTVLPYNSTELKPTWTLDGKAVPYIAMERLEGGESDNLDFLSYWEKGLADTVQVEAAAIPVEKINGPVLLFSGKADQVWPSARMGDMIEQRLNKTGFAYTVQNIQYDNAGHLISGEPFSDNYMEKGQIQIQGKIYNYAFGGTREGEKNAKEDAYKRVFEYLNEFFLHSNKE